MILKNDFIVRIHKCYKGASHTLKNSHTANIKAFVSLQVSFFPGVTRSPPLHDVRPHFKIQCRLEHWVQTNVCMFLHDARKSAH